VNVCPDIQQGRLLGKTVPLRSLFPPRSFTNYRIRHIAHTSVANLVVSSAAHRLPCKSKCCQLSRLLRGEPGAMKNSMLPTWSAPQRRTSCSAKLNVANLVSSSAAHQLPYKTQCCQLGQLLRGAPVAVQNSMLPTWSVPQRRTSCSAKLNVANLVSSSEAHQVPCKTQCCQLGRLLRGAPVAMQNSMLPTWSAPQRRTSCSANPHNCCDPVPTFCISTCLGHFQAATVNRPPPSTNISSKGYRGLNTL
jgi:hypothetical protein